MDISDIFVDYHVNLLNEFRENEIAHNLATVKQRYEGKVLALLEEVKKGKCCQGVGNNRERSGGECICACVCTGRLNGNEESAFANVPDKVSGDKSEDVKMKIKIEEEEQNGNCLQMERFQTEWQQDEKIDSPSEFIKVDDDLKFLNERDFFFKVPLKEECDRKVMFNRLVDEIKKKGYTNVYRSVYLQTVRRNQAKILDDQGGSTKSGGCNECEHPLLLDYVERLREEFSLFYFDLFLCILKGILTVEDGISFIVNDLSRVHITCFQKAWDALAETGKTENGEYVEVCPQKGQENMNFSSEEDNYRKKHLLERVKLPLKEIILNSLHYMVEVIDHVREHKKDAYVKYKDILAKCIVLLERSKFITYKEATTYIECRNFDRLNIFNKELNKLVTKMKTKNMYSISVYNLLREDVNGYTKIIYLLEIFFSPRESYKRKVNFKGNNKEGNKRTISRILLKFKRNKEKENRKNGVRRNGCKGKNSSIHIRDLTKRFKRERDQDTDAINQYPCDSPPPDRLSSSLSTSTWSRQNEIGGNRRKRPKYDNMSPSREEKKSAQGEIACDGMACDEMTCEEKRIELAKMVKRKWRRHLRCYYCSELLRLKRNIFTVAGLHNLCPRRILSILLFYYEQNVNSHKQLLPLFHLFSKETITDVILLELKMKNCYIREKEKDEINILKYISKNDNGEKTWEYNNVSYSYPSFFTNCSQLFTPNYFKMCSILILNDLLSINSFYANILPSDDLLKNAFVELYTKFNNDYDHVNVDNVNNPFYYYIPLDINTLFNAYEKVKKYNTKGKNNDKMKGNYTDSYEHISSSNAISNTLRSSSKTVDVLPPNGCIGNRDNISLPGQTSNKGSCYTHIRSNNSSKGKNVQVHKYKSVMEILEVCNPSYAYDEVINYMLNIKNSEIKKKYEHIIGQDNKEPLECYLYDILNSKPNSNHDNFVKTYIEREIKLRSEVTNSKYLTNTNAYMYLFHEDDNYFFVMNRIFFMNSPKFLFLASLIDLNAWALMHTLLEHMASYTCNPFLNYFVNISLARLISYLISSFEDTFLSTEEQNSKSNTPVLSDYVEGEGLEEENSGECFFCHINMDAKKLCGYESVQVINRNKKHLQNLFKNEKRILMKKKKLKHLIRSCSFGDVKKMKCTSGSGEVARSADARKGRNLSHGFKKIKSALLRKRLISFGFNSDWESVRFLLLNAHLPPEEDDSKEDAHIGDEELERNIPLSYSRSASHEVNTATGCLQEENVQVNFDTFLNFFVSNRESNTYVKEVKTIGEFFEKMLFFLKLLGYYGYIHKSLQKRILRIMHAYAKRMAELHQDSSDTSEMKGTRKQNDLHGHDDSFDDMFVKIFFLSLTNEDEEIDSKRCVNEDIWNVLNVVPLSRRYKIYMKFFRSLEKHKRGISQLRSCARTSGKDGVKDGEKDIEKNGEKDIEKNGEKDIEKNGEKGIEKNGEKGIEKNGEKNEQVGGKEIQSEWVMRHDRSLALLSNMNFEQARSKIRKIIKRITSDIVKDRYNSKVQNLLMQFTKFIDRNPFVTSDIILQQCELFDSNMIITLSESIKHIHIFSCEIFLYKIVERQQLLNVQNYQLSKQYSNNSSDLFDDSIFKPKKLINLSLVSAKFLSKHPSVDLYPLIISTVKRIFSELHTADELFLRKASEDVIATTDITDPDVDNDRVGRAEVLLNALNKKYPDVMSGYIFDIDYIQKLIEIYGGTKASVDVQELNEDQLNAQCGFKLLKEEIMILEDTLTIDINNEMYERSERAEMEDKKLKKLCLQNASKTLLNPNIIYLLFCILSKLKHEYLYDSNTNNLRNLSCLFDKIHAVLLHFIEFLQSNSEPHVYLALIPCTEQIFQFFDIAQSFHIVRFAFPFFAQRGGELGNVLLRRVVWTGDGTETGVEPQGTNEKKESQTGERSSNNIGDLLTNSGKDINMNNVSVHNERDEQNDTSYIDQEKGKEWKQLLMPFVYKYINADNLNGINVNFYLTYWRLSISDVYVPHKQYLKVIEKYDLYIKKLEKYEEEKKKNEDHQWVQKKIQKLHKKRECMKNEYESHILHTNKIKNMLVDVIDHWVDPDKIELNTFTEFTKSLIAPRILYSEKDSLFCSKFVQLLLEFRTPLFNFCALVHVFTKMLIPLINTCTEKEALNIGIFFNDFFSYIYLLCDDVRRFHTVTDKNPCFSYTLNFESKDTIKHACIVEKVFKWEISLVTLLFENNNYEKTWIGSKSFVIFLFRFLNSFPHSAKIKGSIKKYLHNLQTFAQNKGWKDISISINSLRAIMERNRKCATIEKEETEGKGNENKGSPSKASAPTSNLDGSVTMNPFNTSNPVHMNSSTPFMPVSKNLYNTTLEIFLIMFQRQSIHGEQNTICANDMYPVIPNTVNIPSKLYMKDANFNPKIAPPQDPNKVAQCDDWRATGIV
ncbi:THO complex subunit 2, putative (THO2) [Plasmodium ovale curtisi]|uniref:THO complex subunit 2, putative (THO2) n=1 Tax=Plasmodium ovale curtisi TaxID=864141 RepID=A0A1A8WAI5_PLAOA|nr:THO complex subunit 2, putative (THO2) [Plasmodium ovale curtisi]